MKTGLQKEDGRHRLDNHFFIEAGLELRQEKYDIKPVRVYKRCGNRYYSRYYKELQFTGRQGLAETFEKILR